MEKKYVYDGKEWSEKEIAAMLADSEKNPLPSRAVKILEMVEGDYILDVGCGIGCFAHLVAKRAKKVVAIDILESSIEIARDFSAADNIEFKAGDLFALNLPGNSFDCIIFLETIEHINSPVDFLQEFYRILKPNGYLILSTPNAHSYLNIIQHLLFFKHGYAKKTANYVDNEQRNTGTQQDHIYNWDFTTLYRLLNRNGFTYTDHAFTTYGPVTIPLKWLTLQFPFWTKGESWVMSVLIPFRQTLIFKVQKKEINSIRDRK